MTTRGREASGTPKIIVFGAIEYCKLKLRRKKLKEVVFWLSLLMFSSSYAFVKLYIYTSAVYPEPLRRNFSSVRYFIEDYALVFWVIPFLVWTFFSVLILKDYFAAKERKQRY